jgi:hypothetical protein
MHNDTFCLPNISKQCQFLSTLTTIITTISPTLRILWRLLLNVSVWGIQRQQQLQLITAVVGYICGTYNEFPAFL